MDTDVPGTGSWDEDAALDSALAREREIRRQAEAAADQASLQLRRETERLAQALAQERQLRDELESLLEALEDFSTALDLDQIARRLHNHLQPLVPHSRLVLSVDGEHVSAASPSQSREWFRITLAFTTPAGSPGTVELAGDVRYPDSPHHRMAAAIVRGAGAAVDGALALRAARREASVDPLTHLLNRRGLKAAVRSPLAGRNEDARIAVVMLDLDHFKSVNDRYGHAVGDRLLAAVAALCQGSFRATDAVARVGGEEFAIVLPGTDIHSAQPLVERLRARIAELRVAAAGPEGPAVVGVTVSAGIAGWVWPEDLLAETMARADSALYAAKLAGRDRCMVHPGPTTIQAAAGLPQPS